MGGSLTRTLIGLATVLLVILAACAPATPATEAPRPAATQAGAAAPAAAPATAPTSAPAQAPAAAPTSPPAAAKASASEPEKELIMVGSGGPVADGNKACVLEPMAKQYGIKYTYEEAQPGAVISKIIAQKNAPQYDIFTGAEAHLIQGRRAGAFEKNDPAIMPNLADLPDQAKFKDNMGAALGWSAFGIMYRTDKFKENNIPDPTSYQDFFRPELKGRIVLQDSAGVGAAFQLFGFAKAFGGSEQNVEPGFEALKRLKPSILTFGNVTKIDQTIQSGEAWASVQSSSQPGGLQDKGVPVKLVYPKEGGFVTPSIIAVVKNAPHPIAAQVVMNYALSAPAQECLASDKFKNRGPSNVKAQVPASLQDRYIMVGDLKRLTVPDGEYIVDNTPKWTETYTKEIMQ